MDSNAKTILPIAFSNVHNYPVKGSFRPSGSTTRKTREDGARHRQGAVPDPLADSSQPSLPNWEDNNAVACIFLRSKSGAETSEWKSTPLLFMGVKLGQNMGICTIRSTPYWFCFGKVTHELCRSINRFPYDGAALYRAK